MEWLFVIDIVREHGYVSLFIIIVIGLFIFPVPNEVLLMAGGFLATTYLLEPIPTFFIVYSSILLHGTILFFFGKLIAHRPTQLYVHNKASIWQRWGSKGMEAIEKHGLKAASFSYFFPFIRHAVPFSMGLTNRSYRSFSLVSFSSGLVWMTIYFLIGFHYGRTIKDWSSFVEQIVYTLISVACLIIFYQIWRRKKKRVRRLDH